MNDSLNKIKKQRLQKKKIKLKFCRLFYYITTSHNIHVLHYENQMGDDAIIIIKKCCLLSEMKLAFTGAWLKWLPNVAITITANLRTKKHVNASVLWKKDQKIC